MKQWWERGCDLSSHGPMLARRLDQSLVASFLCTRNGCLDVYGVGLADRLLA